MNDCNETTELYVRDVDIWTRRSALICWPFSTFIIGEFFRAVAAPIEEL
jgi:hypothetical protein